MNQIKLLTNRKKKNCSV